MIPRTFHLIWLGGPVPRDYLAGIKTLRSLNPGWAVQWWKEPELAGLTLANRREYDEAEALVPADSVHQLRSDIARYEILLAYGGVYVDLDYRWQVGLEPAVLDPEWDGLVTSWEQQGHHVANGFIASRPDHPLLAEAVEEVPRWCARWGRRGLRTNRLTGPAGLWTDVIWRDLNSERTARVLPQRLLHPVPWNHPEWAEDFDFPDAAAIHLWGHQRSLRARSRS